jgi:hypothetical protein
MTDMPYEGRKRDRLCEACRRYADRNMVRVHPWDHCTHDKSAHCDHETPIEVPKPEPKPEPKANCWCRRWTFPETINLTDSGNQTFKPKHCPECGISLRPKPKCWCEGPQVIPVANEDMMTSIRMPRFNFCPECGRPLTGKAIVEGPRNMTGFDLK